jgi:hypothetical protein
MVIDTVGCLRDCWQWKRWILMLREECLGRTDIRWQRRRRLKWLSRCPDMLKWSVPQGCQGESREIRNHILQGVSGFCPCELRPDNLHSQPEDRLGVISVPHLPCYNFLNNSAFFKPKPVFEFWDHVKRGADADPGRVKVYGMSWKFSTVLLSMYCSDVQ